MAENFILERLHFRLLHILEQRPLDLDHMEFVCAQDLVFCSDISSSTDVPECILETLSELCRLIRAEREHVQDSQPNLQVQISSGHTGHPKIYFSPEYLQHLLEIPLSVTTIASLLRVSRHTVLRRLSENNMSVTALYSKMTDEELDAMVADIKVSMPHCGYRMMKEALKSRGYLVQLERVMAAMHRVDTIGMLTRLAPMGCAVRQTYSVPAPRSLVHIDTNYKLIRYIIVIFGGIDGFSRKTMYLGAPSNNLSSTNLAFFLWKNMVFHSGNVVIYSIYKPNYNKDTTKADLYCNKTLYLFAFWSTNLTYMLLAVLFFSCCCCKQQEAADDNEAQWLLRE